MPREADQELPVADLDLVCAEVAALLGYAGLQRLRQGLCRRESGTCCGGPSVTGGRAVPIEKL